MTSAERRVAIDRDLDNCLRLRILVNEVIANPTQANVDAVISAASNTSKLKVRLTHSLDGESYDWTGFRKSLLEEIRQLHELQLLFKAPFEVRSRSVT